MIDFRYHIVSLAAVLLALAVGIVLGAGPLRDELATTVEGQIQELRDERAELRTELDAAVRREESKDALVAGITPVVAGDRLSDRRVALVLFPGTDGDLAAAASASISAAGGTVISTTDLRPDLENPDGAATRREAAAELAALVGDPPPREGTEPTLPTVLAAVLVSADEPGQSGTAAQAYVRLEQLGLLETTWADNQSLPGITDRRPPDALVLVTGGLETVDAGEGEGVTVDQVRLSDRVELVAALGATDVPVLVLGSGTEAFQTPAQLTDSPVITALRADGDVRDEVSTVDNGEGAAGQLAVVLALAEALAGGGGHYGLGCRRRRPDPGGARTSGAGAHPLPNIGITHRPPTADDGAVTSSATPPSATTSP